MGLGNLAILARMASQASDYTAGVRAQEKEDRDLARQQRLDEEGIRVNEAHIREADARVANAALERDALVKAKTDDDQRRMRKDAMTRTSFAGLNLYSTGAPGAPKYVLDDEGRVVPGANADALERANQLFVDPKAQIDVNNPTDALAVEFLRSRPELGNRQALDTGLYAAFGPTGKEHQEVWDKVTNAQAATQKDLATAVENAQRGFSTLFDRYQERKDGKTDIEALLGEVTDEQKKAKDDKGVTFEKRARVLAAQLDDAKAALANFEANRYKTAERSVQEILDLKHRYSRGIKPLARDAGYDQGWAETYSDSRDVGNRQKETRALLSTASALPAALAEQLPIPGGDVMLPEVAASGTEMPGRVVTPPPILGPNAEDAPVRWIQLPENVGNRPTGTPELPSRVAPVIPKAPLSISPSRLLDLQILDSSGPYRFTGNRLP